MNTDKRIQAEVTAYRKAFQANKKAYAANKRSYENLVKAATKLSFSLRANALKLNK